MEHPAMLGTQVNKD